MSNIVKHICIVSLAVFGASVSMPAYAGAVIAGFDGSTIAANDDGFAGPATLGFTVNYFGVSRTTAYVSNNGYLTFNSGQSNYTPFGLGAGYVGQPIISPFFADVDTRMGALVTYGTGTFAGHDAFGANWVDVGYYNQHTDKRNSFQTILVNRQDTGAGNFDIYFNYDRIVWETGDASGGVNGLGGTSAAAGYNAGTGAPGSYYELPGSRVNGAFLDGGANSLVAGGNTGVAGRYLFQVRNGAVVIPGVPEPATWAMFILGFGAVGFVMRNRKRTMRVGFA